jgi:hypothetical protein
MAVYIVSNSNGERINLIEIDALQVAEYSQLTGMTLSLPEESGADQPEESQMKQALRTLGVDTEGA